MCSEISITLKSVLNHVASQLGCIFGSRQGFFFSCQNTDTGFGMESKASLRNFSIEGVLGLYGQVLEAGDYRGGFLWAAARSSLLSSRANGSQLKDGHATGKAGTIRNGGRASEKTDLRWRKRSLCTGVIAAKGEQGVNMWEEQPWKHQAHGTDGAETAVEVGGGEKVL